VRVKLKLQDLFSAIELYKDLSFVSNIPLFIKNNFLKVKNEFGIFVSVNALTVKSDLLLKLTFSDNITITCGSSHLICFDGINSKFAKDFCVNDKLLTSEGEYLKLIVKEILYVDKVYDLSIESETHLYQTPNKLIHHNSFIVEDILENDFNMKRDIHYVVYKGSTTESGLYNALVQNYNRITIFDDCDAIWSDKNAINLLKGALESTVPKISKQGYYFEIKYIIFSESKKKRKKESDEEGLEETTILGKEEYIFRSQNADIEDEALKQFNNQVVSKLEDGFIYKIQSVEKIKTQFVKPKRYISKLTAYRGGYPVEYHGKMIFISNLPISYFNDAVKSRMRLASLDLTPDQIVQYIRKISRYIMPHIDNEQLKKQVLDFYESHLDLPLNLRTFTTALDTAITYPTEWQQIILNYKE
jgi:hypothetical protein